LRYEINNAKSSTDYRRDRLRGLKGGLTYPAKRLGPWKIASGRSKRMLPAVFGDRGLI